MAHLGGEDFAYQTSSDFVASGSHPIPLS
ncbi:hypothetical protein AZE42_11347 [Rhizopogon vesiculosus]|uniref:Uncharacterized protein n=1 Tax=Rhizopogon vesiculosus TaxID=180088 RepID=A0A1J8QMU2_9AGAM|nr:hypothetical protein AZE42_11347 [Rhizopogon vesiculosus]